jgi:hypothetical protein
LSIHVPSSIYTQLGARIQSPCGAGERSLED